MRLLLDLPEEGGYFRRDGRAPVDGRRALADGPRAAVRGPARGGLSPAKPFASAEETAGAGRAAGGLRAPPRDAAAWRTCRSSFEEAVRHLDWCPIAPHGHRHRTAGHAVVAARAAVPRHAAGPARSGARPGPARAPPCPRRATAWRRQSMRVDVAATTDAARLRYLQVARGPRGSSATTGRSTSFTPAAATPRWTRCSAASSRAACRWTRWRSPAPRTPTRNSFVGESQPLDWPVTLSSGVPATMTRPGRLLLRFCDWVGSDFAAADLRRLLQSGDCAPRAFDASRTMRTGSSRRARPRGCC